MPFVERLSGNSIAGESVRGAPSAPIESATSQRSFAIRMTPRPAARLRSSLRALCVLTLALGFPATAAAQVGPPDVIYIYASESAGVVELAGVPTDLVADGDRTFALVYDPALDESSLAIVTAATTAELLPLGPGVARGLAIAPDGSELWVSLSGDPRVVIVSIDIANSTYGAVIDTLPVAGATELGRLHPIPQLDAMLLLEPGSERLTIYDRVTRTPESVLDVGDRPLAAAVSKSRDHIHVVVEGSDSIRTWDWTLEAWVGEPVSPRSETPVGIASAELVLHQDALYWIDSRRSDVVVLSASDTGLRVESEIDTTRAGLARGIVTGDDQHLVITSPETDELLVIDLDPGATTFEQVIMGVPTRAEPFGVIRDFQHRDRVIVTERASGTISWSRLPLAQIFIRGDCNGDAQVGLGDFVSLLGGLFDSEAGEFFCADACDSNDDGTVDLGDAIFGLQALFVTGSPAIPSPFQDCGLDPTDDTVPCLVSLWCP